MSLIVDKILKNDRLKKLLYYTSKDCLSRPNLTEDQSFELFEKNIKNVPKFYIDGSVLNYILINFDNFIPSLNPEFRDNQIEFDIICHFDQWNLGDFKLRPFLIAAELDTMFNNKHLTGIGKLQFTGANHILLTNEFAGICLTYQAIHGGEDKKFLPNPDDDAAFIENFNNIFNKKDDE